MRESLTEKHLKIPFAVARRFMRLYGLRKHRFDELLSEGFLGLLQSYDCYDSARDKYRESGGLDTFLYRRVILFVRRLLTNPSISSQRWDELASLEQVAESSGFTPPAREFAPESETREFAEYCLSVLDPHHRDIVVAVVMDGESMREVGDRHGLSRQQVSHALARAMTTMRRVAEPDWPDRHK